MALAIPIDIKTKDQITEGECDFSQGHCFGSDGGSGIPPDRKVAKGRGGEQEVWTLDKLKEKIEKKEIYERCQYCQKYNYVKDKE